MIDAKLIFDILESYTRTQEGRVLYLLALLCGVMIADFLIGTFAAWRNPNINFNSAAGINGIIRKISSILLFIICIPLSVIIPNGMGLTALSVLYAGYTVMELGSIIENLEKLGVKQIEPLKAFAAKLGANGGKDINLNSKDRK